MTDHAKVEQRHLDAARAIPRIPGLGHTERNVAQALADAEMAGREWMRDRARACSGALAERFSIRAGRHMNIDAAHVLAAACIDMDVCTNAIASLPLTDTPEDTQC